MNSNEWYINLGWKEALDAVAKEIEMMENTPPPHMQMWASDQFIHIYNKRYELFKASIESLRKGEPTPSGP